MGNSHDLFGKVSFKLQVVVQLLTLPMWRLPLLPSHRHSSILSKLSDSISHICGTLPMSRKMEALLPLPLRKPLLKNFSCSSEINWTVKASDSSSTHPKSRVRSMINEYNMKTHPFWTSSYNVFPPGNRSLLCLFGQLPYRRTCEQIPRRNQWYHRCDTGVLPVGSPSSIVSGDSDILMASPDYQIWPSDVPSKNYRPKSSTARELVHWNLLRPVTVPSHEASESLTWLPVQRSFNYWYVSYDRNLYPVHPFAVLPF